MQKNTPMAGTGGGDWSETGGQPIPASPALSLQLADSRTSFSSSFNQDVESSSAQQKHNVKVSPEKRIRLKCHHNSNIRAVAVDRNTSFQHLKQRLSNDYGFEVSLRYEDADGDLIVLSSQNDLNELVETETRRSVTVHVNNKESMAVSQVLMSPTPVASAGHLRPLPSLPHLGSNGLSCLP